MHTAYVPFLPPALESLCVTDWLTTFVGNTCGAATDAQCKSRISEHVHNIEKLGAAAPLWPTTTELF